jgi:hypothetical protein
VNFERQAGCQKLLFTATAVADRWDRTALKKEHLDEQDVGQILQEMEAGLLPEWKDIADRILIFWVLWNFIIVAVGMLDHHC